MAKNDKGKTIPVKKEAGQKTEVAARPARMLSPLGTWEREIERMFDDFPSWRWPRVLDLERFRFPREPRLQAPALDMYEDRNDVVVKAEIPGMTKDEVEISVSESTLTLKGEKKKEEEVKEKDYYRCEREYGAFMRRVTLPAEVKAEDAKATFKDGVLEIRLPKSEEAKKKAVHVEVQ
jgi:HSP20 family protein